MSLESITPPGWRPPRGYSHGLLAQAGGRALFVAGQIGWDAEERFAGEGLLEQFGQALANVVAVVRAAGGQATDIAEMTIFVTDLGEYRRLLRPLGAAWREHMGRHYPAMALVGVAGLVEPDAVVEIQARAIVPPATP